MVNHEIIIRKAYQNDSISFLDSNNTKYEYLNSIKDVCERIMLKEGRSFIFKYIISSEVNACAFTDNGYDYICVNTGTIDQGVRLSKIIVENHSLRIKENIDKKVLVSILSLLIEWFIAFHEMGHILEGHLEYLSKHNGVQSIISEADNQTCFNDVRNNIIRQAIENDADISAAQFTIDMALNTNAYSGEIPGLTTKEMISLWAYSISIVFYLLGFRAMDIALLDNSNYLPTFLRLISSTEAAYTQISTHYPDVMSKTDFMQLVKDTSTKCFDCLKTNLSDFNMSKYVFTNSEIAKLNNHYNNKVMACYINISKSFNNRRNK